MHSAPSSVHSLHFGFVPSHLDFLDRQISHLVNVNDRDFEENKTTHGYCGSSSRVVNASISTPPFMRIDAIVARLTILIAISHGFSIC